MIWFFIYFIRKCFLDLDTIELLVAIAVPARCSDDIKQCLSSQKFAKHDLQALQPSVVDAIAALLGKSGVQLCMYVYVCVWMYVLNINYIMYECP